MCRARSGSGRRGWQRDAREHELAFSVSYPVLIYGDTERSPELRHEIPLAIGDPFLYLEADGQRAAVLSSLETDRVAALELDLELVSPESLGSDEILAAGGGFRELEEELCLRACGRFGVGRARVPAGFPLALADRLRVAGVAVECDPALFEDRRRVKAGTELEGIRRAQRAAEAGMAAASALLRAAEADDGGLVLDGAPLTCEQVRAASRRRAAHTGRRRATTSSCVPASAEGSVTMPGRARCRRVSRSPSISGRETARPPASQT